MKKIATTTLFYFLFAIIFSTYTWALDIALQDDAPPASVENRIPASLADFLLDEGVDISTLRPALPQSDSTTLQVFASGAFNESCLVLAGPDGRGMVLLVDSAESVYNQNLLITFDITKDEFTIQQRTPECIRHISDIIQSLISVIYSCGIVGDALGCALSVIDLITNLYLFPIICEEEPEERSIL